MALVNKKLEDAKPSSSPDVGIETEVKQEEAHIDKTIELRFPSGFVFSIRVSKVEMVVEAKLRGNTVFMLDQIPLDFVRDLKSMLREF